MQILYIRLNLNFKDTYLLDKKKLNLTKKQVYNEIRPETFFFFLRRGATILQSVEKT